MILKMVHSWLEERGYAPSVRDIACHTDIPSTTVQNNVERLVAQGALARYGRAWDSSRPGCITATRARTLRLTPPGRRLLGLPPEVIRLSDFGPDPIVRLYP